VVPVCGRLFSAARMACVMAVGLLLVRVREVQAVSGSNPAVRRAPPRNCLLLAGEVRARSKEFMRPTQGAAPCRWSGCVCRRERERVLAAS
jgi:hypothetical protein